MIDASVVAASVATTTTTTVKSMVIDEMILLVVVLQLMVFVMFPNVHRHFHFPDDGNLLHHRIGNMDWLVDDLWLAISIGQRQASHQ